MTEADIITALNRVSEIDDMFEAATGWGSWMVEAANEREGLVIRLQAAGQEIAHKYQARTSNGQAVD